MWIDPQALDTQWPNSTEMVMTDPETKNLTKKQKEAYIAALEEHPTTDRIVKELDDLQVRTGVYGTLFVVRGHINNTIQSAMHSMNNLEDFWEDVYEHPMADFLRHGGIELGLCASVGSSTNLLSSYCDTASSRLNDIVSFLLSFPPFINFINSFISQVPFCQELSTLFQQTHSEFPRNTMDCIEADPALEAQPNFESAAYHGWLNALMDGGATREEALVQMAEGWGLK
ncbi:hypothetical protein DFJ58DRAFT_724474 [Suillus subalutaceus]|uniref:uncharacterized protein n=1 Tax=Suillus subalutaceus TaxID=48586 RepID=UPI001B862BD7|nr:uncharacterized protein DFJ58DRAFT_724474 [Suillus subalutaceus]KAG1864919.1 hypothetical protein DFJ58DRAFT_724474 [Suillus subalutaceus]